MKFSIIISFLILIVAAAIGINDRQRLSTIIVTHTKLVAEAAALGLSVDLENLEEVDSITKRAREDTQAEAKEAAREMIAFALDMQAYKKSGEQPDEETQSRVLDLMDRMLSLDASQLKILIEQFRANTEMDSETRSGMIVFAIMTLAKDHPQAALSIFTESEGLVENAMMGKHLLSSSLTSWASQDPGAALEWVRENGRKHPELITDDVKAGLVKGAGTKDMKLAFDLIDELGMDDPGSALYGLAKGLRSAEERTEFLGLLRGLTEMKDDKNGASGKNAISSLAEGIVKDGFESGSAWITENELTPQEMESIASTISHSSDVSERGKWMQWMGNSSLPENTRDQQIRNSMANWTRNDYRAAGEWLVEAPAGPTKSSAVAAYAVTVAGVDPQTATQWALTLPEEGGREETLQKIHSSWPRDSSEQQAAREAFAKKYGIEE